MMLKQWTQWQGYLCTQQANQLYKYTNKSVRTHPLAGLNNIKETRNYMITFIRTLQTKAAPTSADGYVFCRTTGEVDITVLLKKYYNDYVKRGYTPKLTEEEFCNAAHSLTNDCEDISFVALKEDEPVAFVKFARDFKHYDKALGMFEYGSLSDEYTPVLDKLIEYAVCAVQDCIDTVYTECLETDNWCTDLLERHQFSRV